MSDGNFNTQLLSHGGFSSGVRAGEARMKQRALKHLREVLIHDAGFTEERADALCAMVKSRLDQS